MHRCARCGEEKAADAFGKNRRNANGLATYCRDCFAVINRLSRERKAGAAGRELPPPREVLPDGQRRCPDCAQVQPLEAFVRNRSAPTGFGTYCRPCQNARVRASVVRRHGSARHYHLVRRYGLTAAEVDALIAAQDGRCKVCGRSLGAKPHVDHCHGTGRIRGVLCFTCNAALGNMQDDPARLKLGAAYLEGFLDLQPPPDTSWLECQGWQRSRAHLGSAG